jgi:hypothetical protein
MKGFSFVTPVTGLSRPNTGKEDDDDDDTVLFFPYTELYCEWVCSKICREHFITNTLKRAKGIHK